MENKDNISDILNFLFSISNKTLHLFLNTIFNNNYAPNKVKIVKNDILHNLLMNTSEKAYSINYSVCKENIFIYLSHIILHSKYYSDAGKRNLHKAIYIQNQIILCVSDLNIDNLNLRLTYEPLQRVNVEIPIIKIASYSLNKMFDNNMYFLWPLLLFKYINKYDKFSSFQRFKSTSRLMVYELYEIYINNLIDINDYGIVIYSIYLIVRYLNLNYFKNYCIEEEIYQLIKELYEPAIADFFENKGKNEKEKEIIINAIQIGLDDEEISKLVNKTIEEIKFIRHVNKMTKKKNNNLLTIVKQ